MRWTNCICALPLVVGCAVSAHHQAGHAGHVHPAAVVTAATSVTIASPLLPRDGVLLVPRADKEDKDDSDDDTGKDSDDKDKDEKATSTTSKKTSTTKDDKTTQTKTTSSKTTSSTTKTTEKTTAKTTSTSSTTSSKTTEQTKTTESSSSSTHTSTSASSTATSSTASNTASSTAASTTSASTSTGTSTSSSTSSATPTETNAAGSKKGLTKGAAAGVAVGCIVAVIGGIAAIFGYLSWRARKSREEKHRSVFGIEGLFPPADPDVPREAKGSPTVSSSTGGLPRPGTAAGGGGSASVRDSMRGSARSVRGSVASAAFLHRSTAGAGASGEVMEQLLLRQGNQHDEGNLISPGLSHGSMTPRSTRSGGLGSPLYSARGSSTSTLSVLPPRSSSSQQLNAESRSSTPATFELQRVPVRKPVPVAVRASTRISTRTSVATPDEPLPLASSSSLTQAPASSSPSPSPAPVQRKREPLTTRPLSFERLGP